ncbi:MAG: hypothetical protein Kow0081_2300 [Candidatus Dojkabacteria bacterium]
MKIFRKTKKAATLPEIMVVLAIISTTLVVSIGILVRSLRTIQINNLEEAANSILIQSLEVAKAPVEVSTTTLPASTGFYTIGRLENGENSIPVLKFITNDIREDFLTLRENIICTENSDYYVSGIFPEQIGIPVCLQLKIQNLGLLENTEYYKVTATIFYESPDGKLVRSIEGYRYNGFIEVS